MEWDWIHVGKLPYETSVETLEVGELLERLEGVVHIDQEISEKDVSYVLKLDKFGHRRIDGEARIPLIVPSIPRVTVRGYLFRKAEALEIFLEDGAGSEPGPFGSINYCYPKFTISVKEPSGVEAIKQINTTLEKFYEENYSCRRKTL